MLTLLVKMGPHGRVIKTRLSLLAVVHRLYRAAHESLHHIRLTTYLDGYLADHNKENPHLILTNSGKEVELGSKLTIVSATDEHYRLSDLGVFFNGNLPQVP